MYFGTVNLNSTLVTLTVSADLQLHTKYRPLAPGFKASYLTEHTEHTLTIAWSDCAIDL